MTTIDAAPDACRGCAQPWRPGELFCSACGTARARTPSPRSVEENRRPIVVLVAQVLMGLSIAANIVWLVLGLSALASLGKLVAVGGPSVAVAALLDALMTFVYVVVMFRAQRGLGERRRSSRTVAAFFPAIDWILGLLLAALSGQTLLGGALWLVVGLPWSALIASLLWLPHDSQRWFRDLPATGHGPLSRDENGRRRPLPADDGDWWAAEARRARNAGNVPRNKQASRPRTAEPPSTGRHARTSVPAPPSPTGVRPRPAAGAPSGAPPFSDAPSFPSAPSSFPLGPSSANGSVPGAPRSGSFVAPRPGSLPTPAAGPRKDVP